MDRFVHAEAGAVQGGAHSCLIDTHCVRARSMSDMPAERHNILINRQVGDFIERSKRINHAHRQIKRDHVHVVKLLVNVYAVTVQKRVELPRRLPAQLHYHVDVVTVVVARLLAQGIRNLLAFDRLLLLWIAVAGITGSDSRRVADDYAYA